MYNKNSLSKLAQTLSKVDKVDLGSEYKNELFRGHINAAKENLLRASELAGDKDLPLNWGVLLSREMVIVLVCLSFFALVFFASGIL